MFKAKIVSHLINLSKSKNLSKVGIERELFVIKNDKKMANHEDISKFFQSLGDKNSFKVSYNKYSNNILALGACSNNFCFHSEPGCQLEVSFNPFFDIDKIKSNCIKYNELISKEMPDCHILAYGVNPIYDLDQIPFLEKTRYKIMWDYMFKNNIFGHMMMKSTCTMQFNIDYSSENNAYKKFLASILIQPILIALFANSRYKNRKDTGFSSYRSYIWQAMSKLMRFNLDSGYYSRAGIPGFIFSCNKENFFSEYVEYCMNVPIIFCCRDNNYIIFGNKYKFSDFINGKIQESIISGEFIPEVFIDNNKIDIDFNKKDLREEVANLISPNEDDWYNHVNTIFFETRIQKGYIEMRSLDSCPEDCLLAASDFWLQFSLRDDLIDFILDNFSFSGNSIDQNLKCEDLYYKGAKFGLGDSEIYQSAKKLISILDSKSLAKEIFSELLLRDPKKDILDISFLIN